MGAKLDVRLRVLIPAVENSVSGNAYRPADVFPSRKGLTVEIGNTDAEGRLVLADALAEADSEAPDLLIDIATLTGAARVATGMELPPFFTDDEMLAADLMRPAAAVHDPLWRLPLWRGYEADAGKLRRRSHQQSRLRLCGRHHGGAVPQPLRRPRRKAGCISTSPPGRTVRSPGRPRGAEANAARAAERMPAAAKRVSAHSY